MSHATTPALYGLVAEFETATDLVVAAKAAYAAGYRKMDAYSPYPVEEAAEAIGFHKTRVPLIVLLGGILGGLVGIRLAVLDQRHRLSAEHRRAPLEFLAGVHRPDVRDDRAVRAAWPESLACSP